MIAKLMGVVVLMNISVTSQALAATQLSSKNYIYWAPLKSLAQPTTVKGGKSGQITLPVRPQLPIKSVSSQVKYALFSQGKVLSDGKQVQSYDVLWLDYPVLVGKDVHKPMQTRRMPL